MQTLSLIYFNTGKLTLHILSNPVHVWLSIFKCFTGLNRDFKKIILIFFFGYWAPRNNLRFKALQTLSILWYNKTLFTIQFFEQLHLAFTLFGWFTGLNRGLPMEYFDFLTVPEKQQITQLGHFEMFASCFAQRLNWNYIFETPCTLFATKAMVTG